MLKKLSNRKMKSNLEKIISTVLSDCEAQWKSICIDAVTYTVFALPYTQLDLPPEGYAFVDSYYVASNKAYFLRKKLCEDLAQAGFETVECTLPYKNIAHLAGLGVPLRSTLIANETYGTRMALEIIGVRGVFAEEASLSNAAKKPEISEICSSCGICEKLCPNGCIGDGSFLRERCIRSLQEASDFPDEAAADSIGTQLWGCDICQRYCPFNKHLESREMTEKEKELFSIENLFAAFSSGKKGCEPYRDILGGNYLRPAKLTALVLSVMANTANPKQYEKYAAAMLNHSDERVRKAAQRLTDKINNQ